jgi:hypothetical protein
MEHSRLVNKKNWGEVLGRSVFENKKFSAEKHCVDAIGPLCRTYNVYRYVFYAENVFGDPVDPTERIYRVYAKHFWAENVSADPVNPVDPRSSNSSN